jgi:hypothetical protein
MNLRNDCATGWDSIPAKLLKMAKNTILAPLTKLIELCLGQGVSPRGLVPDTTQVSYNYLIMRDMWAQVHGRGERPGARVRVADAAARALAAPAPSPHKRARRLLRAHPPRRRAQPAHAVLHTRVSGTAC